MPLSEHEQRLLDQIERALYAEDPKFASVVRSSDLKTHLRRRIRRSVVVLVLGLVVVVVGAVVKLWPVGVAGFVLMLAAVLVATRSVQRMRRGDAPPPPRPVRRARTKRRSGEPGSGDGLLGRFEERWNRRWDGRDD